MDVKYLSKIGIHLVFGALLYYVGIFPKLYFFGVFAYFFVRIVSVDKKEKSIEVLKACAYLVGAEVIFRMTGAGLFYESSKYFIIFFIVLGMFYDGVSNRAYPYFIFLICLVPSIIVASINIGYESNLRTNVAFVLSGPVCLGMSALYCYDKRISQRQILDVLYFLGLPIVALAIYLFIYSPSLKEIISGTESNFAASGGFGPNQVATTLGLGMFVYCINYFLRSKTLLIKIVNIVLFGLIGFRGIVTFSRGGIFTAILMIISFLAIYYFKSSYKQKNMIAISFMLLIVASSITWMISSDQTNGFIDKRYTNQDKMGKQKEDISTGRVDLFIGELQGYVDSPFFGVGASGMKERRIKTHGYILATHNELSRLLSEHGILGIFMLLILIFKPLDLRSENTNNYFFYAFLVFWFATINHSAMRIAAPGFIYALALLNVRNEKRPVHRKRLIE